jgi:phage baseplate assembly protein W
MVYKDYTFSDLDVDFSRNSITGDISLKKDLQSIRQSIVNILLTRPKERFFSSSDIGVGLQDLYFELKDNDGVIFSSIKERVKSNINKFEPRVRFSDFIIVDDEYNSLGDNAVIVEILYDVVSFGNNSNITETSNISDGVRLTIGNG